MLRQLAVAAVLAVVSFSAFAITPATAVDDWKRMQEWRFGGSVPVPPEGIVLQRDVATFTLQSGTVRLMEPTGTSSHGLVFEGKGTLRIEVPDRNELYQLRRFAGDPELMRMEASFTRLYLRSSDDLAARTRLSFEGPAEPNAEAKKRQELWLIEEWLDADARVAAAALNDGALWERADVLTDSWSWISFTFDSMADEEIVLSRFDEGFTESWLSLQRAEHRNSTHPWKGQFDVEHFAIRGDLTKKGRGQAVGAKMERPTDANLTIDVRLTSFEDGLGSMTFSLHPEARELAVKSAAGEPLGVIRDHLGARSLRIDKKYSDPMVTVVLDRRLARGEETTLRFEYILEIPTFAIGDSWYPTKPDDWNDSYTASMQLTYPEGHEVKAMGTPDGAGRAGGNVTTTWTVDEPALMLTFCIASRFDERTIELEGIPTVHSFGPTVGLSNRHQVKNVAIDVANSLRFFAWLFDTPLEEGDFWVTSIPSGHGQAFDGFLHLSEGTYHADTAGVSELFRAHEVAHQWWGHRVRWASYRDQWISEAFAEYAAMMFVQTTVDGGQKYFDEILGVYDAILKGSISGGFSRFNRPWLVALNPSYRGRVGPITHGWRASTKEIPGGYQIQAYVRGPMVIHMLRTMLHRETRSDDAFIAFLRDFVRTHDGKAASTDDLAASLQRVTGRDYRWFLDQWLRRSEIPTVEWSYTTRPGEGGTIMSIQMARTGGEGEGFVLPIPIRLELGGGRSGTLVLNLDEREKTFEQKLPAAPANVTINPDFGLLLYTTKK